jgi:hypothetical protein
VGQTAIQWPQPIHPNIADSLVHAFPFFNFRLKSLQTFTHDPHPLQTLSFILISAGSFVLDVGIAMVFGFKKNSQFIGNIIFQSN